MTHPTTEQKRYAPKPGRDPKKEKGSELRGAFAAVMLLGAFILITWAGVFWLFLARN